MNGVGWHYPRLVLGIFLLSIAGLPIYTNISVWPQYLYSPAPGIHALFFEQFPSLEVLAVVTVFQIVAFVFWVLNWQARIMAALVFACLWYGLGFRYGLGKLDHGYNLLMGFFFIHAIFPSKALCFDESMSPWTNPLAVFICFCYFTAGWAKWMDGWLDIHSQTAMYILIRDAHANFIPFVKSKFLWEIPDYATTVWELSMPIMLINNRLFKIGLIITAIFHLIISLCFQIAFEANLWCLLWFLPLSLPNNLIKFTPWVFGMSVITALFSVFYIKTDIPSTSVFQYGFSANFAENAACILLALLFIALGIFSQLKKKQAATIA